MELVLRELSARHPAAPAAAVALRGVSLRIERGQAVAIIGPSGAGKTTLLHAMACALEPASGELLVNGLAPWRLGRRQLKSLRGSLVLAPQVPPLPPRQRVVTSVLAGRLPHMGFWSSMASLFYPTDIEAARKALAAFDLEDKIFDRVDRLSGGERQRVGLARILVAQADLWLVDEPLSALDPTRSTQALAALVAQAAAKQATLVCSLHQVERALAVFPRIIGLREGDLAFDLPATQVTDARLRALYAQHESELFGDSPVNDFPDVPVVSPTPAAMHCR